MGVLKGAVFFMADLVRRITVPCEIDFMAVSSYGSSTDSSGVVRILKDLDANIEGRHVVIDRGHRRLRPDPVLPACATCRRERPASLEVCALLTKPERREADIECRYVGFEIPNRFAIGYGLDYGERYRSLPVRRRPGRVAAARRACLTTLLQAGPRRADRRNDPDAENARTLAYWLVTAVIHAWYRSDGRLIQSSRTDRCETVSSQSPRQVGEASLVSRFFKSAAFPIVVVSCWRSSR